MLALLEDFLIENATPQERVLFERAYNVFDRYELSIQDAEIVQNIVLQDESDPGNTLTYLRDQFTGFLSSLLAQHQVRVFSDTIPFDLLIDLNDVLIRLPDYEDPEAILQITQQHLSSTETFAELVEHLTDHAAENVLNHLDFVSQMLIVRIEELMDQALVDEVDQTEQLEKSARTERYRKLMDFLQLKENDTLIQSLISQGVEANLPFDVYVNLLGHDFENLPKDAIAINLLAMAILSTDGYENPPQRIQLSMDSLLSDVHLITEVSLAIRQLYVKFTQHEQT